MSISSIAVIREALPLVLSLNRDIGIDQSLGLPMLPPVFLQIIIVALIRKTHVAKRGLRLGSAGYGCLRYPQVLRRLSKQNIFGDKTLLINICAKCTQMALKAESKMERLLVILNVGPQLDPPVRGAWLRIFLYSYKRAKRSYSSPSSTA